MLCIIPCDICQQKENIIIYFYWLANNFSCNSHIGPSKVLSLLVYRMLQFIVPLILRELYILFQSTFPVLAETDVKISLNEKSTQPFTVFMHSLNFLNSYLQFFVVNVWMVKCDVSSTRLEVTNIRNVTIENCTFGNWTFRQVGHVMIKNSRSCILKDFPTSLNFYNSSGLMENINIKNLNLTNMSNGLIIQNSSYIQITQSNFVNNTVSYGLIKVLNSSTLQMSDCTLQKNKAIDYAKVILIIVAI